MVKANFDHEGNSGLLTVSTHFGRTVQIPCTKRDSEIFRLGGTAINEVVVYEGLLLELNEPLSPTRFRAFRTPENTFESTGILSDEEWSNADLHCWATEHYDVDMEGRAHGWILSKTPIRDAHQLFVNMDVIDGGGNLIKRYRVSPFTGEHRVMESFNG